MRELTDDEWREFQSIPDQGYSHRHWVNTKIKKRLDQQRATADAVASRQRITYDEDGVLDEVVLQAVDHVHVERMGEAQWWVGISYKGELLMVNIGAVNHQAKGYGNAEWDGNDPLALEGAEQ